MALECYHCKAPIVKDLCECHTPRAITGTWTRLSAGGRGIRFLDTEGIEVGDRLVVTVTGRSGRVRQVYCQVFWFGPGRRRGLARKLTRRERSRKVTRRERRSMRRSVRKGRHDWCGFEGGCWSRDHPCAAAELI